jgi:hypothetical protein
MTQDYSDYPGPEFMFNMRFNVLHRLLVHKFNHMQKLVFNFNQFLVSLSEILLIINNLSALDYFTHTPKNDTVIS